MKRRNNMERLIEKADLQDKFKADLIDKVLVHELINEETKEPYEWEELRVLSYDELVDLLVDSKKMYVVEL